jgi:hypothetical protein
MFWERITEPREFGHTERFFFSARGETGCKLVMCLDI